MVVSGELPAPATTFHRERNPRNILGGSQSQSGRDERKNSSIFRASYPCYLGHIYIIINSQTMRVWTINNNVRRQYTVFYYFLNRVWHPQRILKASHDNESFRTSLNCSSSRKSHTCTSNLWGASQSKADVSLVIITAVASFKLL
jgi:hypothetical protein